MKFDFERKRFQFNKPTFHARENMLLSAKFSFIFGDSVIKSCECAQHGHPESPAFFGFHLGSVERFGVENKLMVPQRGIFK